jgi:hypothetical protein
MSPKGSGQLQAEAWVGDAVLCLYSGLRIPRRQGKVDGAQYQRMACNPFLSAFGEKSKGPSCYATEPRV